MRSLVLLSVVALAAAADLGYGPEEEPVFPCDEPRVRKAWSAHTSEEKTRWLRAVNLLSEQGHYATFVGLHLYNSDWIHDTAYAMVWHRIYSFEFENALRASAEENACLTLPVWDWAADSSSARAANLRGEATPGTPWVEHHAWLKDMGGPSRRPANQMTAEEAATLPGTYNLDAFSGVPGLGLAGNASDEYWHMCMANEVGYWGPLPAPFENFSDFTQSGAFPIMFVTENCSRQFQPIALRSNGTDWHGTGDGYSEDYDAGVLGMTVEDLETMIESTPSFNVPASHREGGDCAASGLIGNVSDVLLSTCGWNIKFQMGPHGWIHGDVDASMSANRSPSDPIFWGHHAMVDYVWDTWSRYHTCPVTDDPDGAFLAGVPYNEVPPEHAGLCEGLFGCEVCGKTLFYSPSGSIGYWVGQNYSDGYDSPLPWAPLEALLRAPFLKPPGVTQRTWAGLRTAREILSLTHWGTYSYDTDSLSLFQDTSKIAKSAATDAAAPAATPRAAVATNSASTGAAAPAATPRATAAVATKSVATAAAAPTATPPTTAAVASLAAEVPKSASTSAVPSWLLVGVPGVAVALVALVRSRINRAALQAERQAQGFVAIP